MLLFDRLHWRVIHVNIHMVLAPFLKKTLIEDRPQTMSVLINKNIMN